jgi:hypothetical protein
MKFNLLTILAVFFSSYSVNLHAQSESKEEFEFLNSEINILLNYQNNHFDDTSLLDSLKYYSNQGEYDIAIVFAEIVLDDLKPSDSKPEAPIKKADEFPDFQFNVAIGADLNRQEFEIDYIEKDSLLIDEIQNPYVALKSKYQVLGDYNNGLVNNLEFRFDKQNIRSSIDLAGNISTSKVNSSAKIGFIYDKDKIYPELSFSELSSQLLANADLSSSFYLQMNETFRYKNYHKKSDNLPDFIFNQFRVLTGSRHTKNTDMYLSYNMLLNESLKNENNDYLEHECFLGLTHGNFSVLTLAPSAGFRYRNYTYVLQDSVVENSTSAPILQFNTVLRFPFGIDWSTEYQWMYKTFFYKSEDDPDYYLNELQTTLRKSIYLGFSVELGYTFEQKMHQYFPSAVKVYIDEQNYTGNGAVIGFDYMNNSNLFISLNGSYTWRRYPYATVSDDFGIYSNRDIYNIFFNIQLPLTKHLDFHLLLVYDNDKDLDSDNNNYNSTIFSSEFRYQF